MYTQQFFKITLAVLVLLFVSGCSLTPQQDTPQLLVKIRDTERFTYSEIPSTEPPAASAWWRTIGGGELDELVTQLLTSSSTLQEARLQAQQATEGTRIARGQRLPSVSAVGDVSRNRGQQLNSNYTWSKTYTAAMQLDFDTDILGGLRAAEDSAALSAIASMLNVQALEQIEIATLASNWVSAATLKRRLELAKRTAESFKSTYELTNERYEAGSSSVTASDVQITLQNLEAARVDIPQLESDLDRQLLIIDEQLSRLPGDSKRRFSGRFSLAAPPEALVGRPASLLANRPDVAAAELLYRAALKDVGAARAALYPGLSLAASLTFQDDSSADLFDWDRHIASLASSLTAPLFQGGRLRSQVRLEKKRAQELASAFARAALAAMMDVEHALVELKGLDAQRLLLASSVQTAELSNQLTQARYRQGLTSILSVLETQRSLDAAQQNVILTEQAIADARINLFLSLGGDWTAADNAMAPSNTSKEDEIHETK